jgi:hypothetical protein
MTEYEALLEAATAYLRSVGAEPVVIGGAGVMPSVDLPMNHYLTLKWTGVWPPPTTSAPLQAPA